MSEASLSGLHCLGAQPQGARMPRASYLCLTRVDLTDYPQVARWVRAPPSLSLEQNSAWAQHIGEPKQTALRRPLLLEGGSLVNLRNQTLEGVRTPYSSASQQVLEAMVPEVGAHYSGSRKPSTSASSGCTKTHRFESALHKHSALRVSLERLEDSRTLWNVLEHPCAVSSELRGPGLREGGEEVWFRRFTTKGERELEEVGAGGERRWERRREVGRARGCQGRAVRCMHPPARRRARKTRPPPPPPAHQPRGSEGGRPREGRGEGCRQPPL
mmetsp:Transcript_4627/g.10158  ORF Transcript_4627/g.10158 Transcript_4627/m.10158 type:complete len:272 (+) Transcript_4627:42-857(+)